MHTIPSSHISANAGVVQVVHTGRVPWFSGSPICYYVPLLPLLHTIERISRSTWMGGTRMVQGWYKRCNDFLHHHRRRCAPISSAQPAMRGTPATPQFRQHNVLAFSIHLHLTFQHSIVRICSQHNATARIENEMLCWRNSFSTHLHLTFQQIVRNFSQHNEWNWTDSDCCCITHKNTNEWGLFLLNTRSLKFGILLCNILKTNWIIWLAKCSFQAGTIAEV